MEYNLQELLQKLGAAPEIIEAFSVNGYCDVEDLKNITGYEIKNVIQKILPRKKFAQAIVPWLIANQQVVDDEIILIAGLHPSQTKVILTGENDSNNSDKGSECSILDSTSSIKSAIFPSKSLSDECATISLISTSGTSVTAEEDNIDLSFFDAGLEEYDLEIRKAQDLAKVKKFEEYTNNQTTPGKPKLNNASLTDRQSNPLWVLLNKGNIESKRISRLAEDTILTTSEIKEIAQVTAQYLFSEAEPPKRQVTPNTCSYWATQYFQPLFPNTGVHRFYFIKREIYINKSGKTLNKARPTGALYTQLCLMRKKLLIQDDTAKIRSSNSSSLSSDATKIPQKVANSSYRSLSGYDSHEYSPPAPDETIESKLIFLRDCTSHASAEVIEAWKDTHVYCMNELKNTQGSVWDYIQLDKGLSNPVIGPILIKKDFDTLFGATETNSKLQDFLISKKTKIIDLAKAVMLKLSADIQKDLIKRFLKLTEEDSNVILQSTGLLLLLPLLFPGVFQVNKHWKPAKSNVLNAFVSNVDTEADVQESLEKMRSHLAEVQNKLKWKQKLRLQPYVLAVGPSWSEIVQAHIVLDKVVYSFPSVPEAVEVCFQLFHSFHAEYPHECHNVWEFIQQAVYDIYTEFDWNHRSTSELAEQLGLKVKND